MKKPKKEKKNKDPLGIKAGKVDLKNWGSDDFFPRPQIIEKHQGPKDAEERGQEEYPYDKSQFDDG